jgi:hypothetical protein
MVLAAAVTAALAVADQAVRMAKSVVTLLVDVLVAVLMVRVVAVYDTETISL